MFVNRFLSLFFFLGLFASLAQGQNAGNSAYSAIGIGDFLGYKGNARNFAMSQSGIGLRDDDVMNMLNPATLAPLKGETRYGQTKAEIGAFFQYRNARYNGANSASGGGNLRYLAIGFPAGKRYFGTIGLKPLSISDNNLTTTATITDDQGTTDAKYRFTSTGGIYSAFFASGLSLSKCFSVGLEAQYLFGSITTQATSQLILNPNDPEAENQYGVRNRSRFSGLGLKPGIYGRFTARKAYKDTVVISNSKPATYFSVGLTYDLYTSVYSSTRKDGIVINERNQIDQDTILSEWTNQWAFPTLPGFGFAYQVPGNFAITADARLNQWANFGTTSGAINPLADTLSNGWAVSIGGEYFFKTEARTPNRLQAGFRYERMPYNLNNQPVNDISFSLGTTLRVGHVRKLQPGASMSMANLALIMGQRGSAAQNQVVERYLQLQVSFLVSAKWFQRYAID
jgi:hypothetical protein